MTSSRGYEAYFIPPEVDSDRAIALGIKWLVEQPGDRLILLHTKQMVGNSRLLERVVAEYRLRVESPQTVWRSGRWHGGPILAPWASPDVIRCIDDELSHTATAVCIIGWHENDPNHQAWVGARDAVDLESGARLGRRPEEIISDPVIRIAFESAERFINHNNALVQAEDKAYLVRTLQELVAGGHLYDVEELAAYAMATGWTGEEVKRIREYGQRVLDGRGFRLQSTIGPGRGACRAWEEEAARQG